MMKEGHENQTALHHASRRGYTNIVELLLTSFGEEKNDELIEYVMQGDEMKYTALHCSSEKKNKENVKLLLNVFSKEKNKKLIEYLMQENDKRNTAFYFARVVVENKEIEKLLFQKHTEASNEILICDLQKVSQMFQKQNASKKENSL